MMCADNVDLCRVVHSLSKLWENLSQEPIDCVGIRRLIVLKGADEKESLSVLEPWRVVCDFCCMRQHKNWTVSLRLVLTKLLRLQSGHSQNCICFNCDVEF